MKELLTYIYFHDIDSNEIDNQILPYFHYPIIPRIGEKVQFHINDKLTEEYIVNDIKHFILHEDKTGFPYHRISIFLKNITITERKNKCKKKQ